MMFAELIVLLQVESPSADQTRDAIRLLLLMTGLAIVSFGFVFLLGIWYLRGRDPHATPLPGSGGRPPGDLPAAVVGSLIDERVDHADLVATLFDLQRRGILTVGRAEQGRGRANGVFQVTLRDPEAPVHDFERPMMTALFGTGAESGASVLLSERAARVAAGYDDMRRALYDDLVGRGFFRRSPQATRDRWNTAGKTLIALGVVIFGIIVVVFDWTAVFPAGALIGIGLALSRLSRHMPAKTKAGAEEAARWRAFQADLTSIARMGDAAPALGVMERYLPYALALGVSTVFVDRFAEALPVNQWATIVRDRMTEIDPSLPDSSWGDALDVGGSVLRHGTGDLSDLRPGSIDLPSLPSVGAPSMETLTSVSDAAGGGMQNASDFVMGLLSAAPDASRGVDAASSAVGAVGNLLTSVDTGAVTGFVSGMADAAPNVLDVAGSVLDVVNSAEVLDLAGSALGALLEGLGDLDF